MCTESGVLAHFFGMNSITSSLDHPKNEKESATWEDSIIDGLESLTGLFDDIYLLKSFGIISESNVLYQKLNKGNLGSKIWFVSSVLSTRKSFCQLIRLIHSRHKLIRECQQLVKSCSNSLKGPLTNKIKQSLISVDRRIRETLLELIQNLAYLLLVTVEIFKINLSGRWKRFLEIISGIVTILRLFNSGFSSVSI